MPHSQLLYFLIKMLFDIANLPYWVLLGIGVTLFAIAISAGGGDQDFDIDADIDADIDFDADIDADADADIGVNLGAMQVLSWIGVGRVPLILLAGIDFSLWGLFGWMLNVVFNLPKGILGSAVFLVSMTGSLVLGGLAARPIGYLFSSFGEDASSDRVIGCVGTVTSATLAPNKLGQVDAIDRDRNLVTISAILPDWATVVPNRGDSVIIIDRQGDRYLAIVANSPDKERWFNN